MPELPEVETVARGLRELIEPPVTVTAAWRGAKTLRFQQQSDRQAHQGLVGQHLQRIDRRGKYLLWHFDKLCAINHLGMTGAWLPPEGERGPHDHLSLTFSNGKSLVFHDPRRFGAWTFTSQDAALSHRLLKAMGPEPLDPAWTPAVLKASLSTRRGPLKAAIMDQKVVVGVGNIYAAEACFRAGIRPTVAANRVSLKRLTALHAAIVQVLSEAIKAGGSTIRDFAHAGGGNGLFQHTFAVYGRGGEPCSVCQTTLKEAQIGGRTSTWCPKCQR